MKNEHREALYDCAEYIKAISGCDTPDVLKAANRALNKESTPERNVFELKVCIRTIIQDLEEGGEIFGTDKARIAFCKKALKKAAQ